MSYYRMSNQEENTSEFDLIAKVLSKEASVDEQQKLEAWIARSPGNQIAFNGAKQLYLASAQKPAVNTDAAWNKLNSRIKDNTHEQSKVVSINWRRNIAAVLVVALGLLGLLKLMSGGEMIEVFALNGVQEVILEDGTHVHLNKGSKLFYPEKFSGDYRNVELIGEAFFDVAKNKNNPFIIHTTQGAKIKVVGTSFNVVAREQTDVVEVVVETGKVILTEDYENNENSSSVELIPGEIGIYSQTQKQAKKSVNINPQFLFWLNKTLIFKKTDLKTVVATLNGIYNVDIHLKNEGLSNCRITATFKNEQLETILMIIEQTLNVKVNARDGHIEIEGNGC
ncbi:MAG: FecR family protein [Flavobacteriales bacterium]|nr:FecR family protein [Flavobacteriales bacterium]